MNVKTTMSYFNCGGLCVAAVLLGAAVSAVGESERFGRCLIVSHWQSCIIINCSSSERRRVDGRRTDLLRVYRKTFHPRPQVLNSIPYNYGVKRFNQVQTMVPNFHMYIIRNIYYLLVLYWVSSLLNLMFSPFFKCL